MNAPVKPTATVALAIEAMTGGAFWSRTTITRVAVAWVAVPVPSPSSVTVNEIE